MKKNRCGLRAVRSYVLREGRLTDGQRRALDELLPVYGIDLSSANGAHVNWRPIFARSASTRLEIGFGDGGALLEMAEKNPDCNFIGVEVHRPGIGRLLLQLQSRNINNVRVFCADGIEVLSTAIAPQALDAIYLYFPDPWPKKKHHKRRIMQTPFVNLAAERLTAAGCLHFATDWQPYSEQALEILEQSGRFENCAGTGQFSPRPPERPLTKFERRGRKLGYEVWDIVMRKAG